VAATVVATLYEWVRHHRDFVVAGNEAGMLLGEDARGADAAVWRRRDAEPRSGGFRRTPPILAVEVAGRDEDEVALRDKASWYLAAGVEVIWLVLPDRREVVELTRTSDRRLSGNSEATAESLPGLSIRVDQLFEQLG
jgi:Uma2 family endonuclease